MDMMDMRVKKALAPSFSADALLFYSTSKESSIKGTCSFEQRQQNPGS